MWLLYHNEDWVQKNSCFQIVGLEKTLESPLDCKEINTVNYKGTPPWIFIGRTDAEAETLVLWSSDVNSQLTGKVPDAEKNKGHQEKRALEDEMAGWHHWCNGHDLRQTSGDGERHGGLQAAAHEVAKSQTWLSGWTSTTKPYYWTMIKSRNHLQQKQNKTVEKSKHVRWSHWRNQRVNHNIPIGKWKGKHKPYGRQQKQF